MTEINALIEGYRRFYDKYFASGNKLYPDLFKLGQSPKTLVIACSDSRVDPSIILNTEPGDIFVIRNVANLVPPFIEDQSGLHGVSAALEFAVRFLEVENIVVLGHSHCAGIQSLLNPKGIGETDFIGEWMKIASQAKKETLSQDDKHELHQHICEKQGILLSLKNLLTFPWIQEKVDKDLLKIHGWYFSIEDGRLQTYQSEAGGFQNIL